MVFYLIGYMGSGKSTLGRKLAKKLEVQFFDTDRMVEERFNLPEFEIYQKYGVSIFRQTEMEIIQEFGQVVNAVVSCGGELPLFLDNMEVLNGMGKTVYVKMSPKSLAIRLFGARKKRYGIQQHLSSVADLEVFIQDQLQQFEFVYNQAQLVVKGESVNVDSVMMEMLQDIMPNGDFDK